MARICIPTLDPRSGGVSALARFVYDTAERVGHNPYLAYNLVDLEKDVRLWDLPVEGFSTGVKHTEFNGREMKFTSRVLPEFEFLHYVLNSKAWKEMLTEADVYFGACGGIQCCHPLSRENVPFGCWVSTTIWDDRKERVKESSIGLQLRDRISKPILESIEGRIYDDASSVFAVSEYTANAIASKFNIERGSIEVVHYPIDTDRFTKIHSNSNDELEILFAGRINDPRKNVRMLFRAFEKIRRNFDEVTLRLIGDEPEPDLISYAEARGILDSVEFAGYVSQNKLPKVYSNADVFTIPSYQEGLGIVGLEAMACETPVVSTRCGGPEDFVRDGKNGYLVPVDNHNEMAQKVTKVLKDDSQRHNFRKKARSIIREKFNKENSEKKFTQVFDQLHKLT